MTVSLFLRLLRNVPTMSLLPGGLKWTATYCVGMGNLFPAGQFIVIKIVLLITLVRLPAAAIPLFQHVTAIVHKACLVTQPVHQVIRSPAPYAWLVRPVLMEARLTLIQTGAK